MSMFRRIFRGWVGKLLLPGVILQSVLIGGGYATGREIVAYGGRYGPDGWPALVAIFLGFTLMSALVFEVARVFRAYEYKRFMRQIIGRLWPAYDLLYAAMAVLVIAVMTSAAENIMRETLGVPSLVGTALVVVSVGILLYFGSHVIEAFKSVGTSLLYAAYVFFALLVLGARWETLPEVFAGVAPAVAEAGMEGAASVEGVASAEGAAPAGDEAGRGGSREVAEAVAGSGGRWAALGTGLLYVGYNLAVFPAVLFSLRRQVSRRETMVASLVAGLLMTVPFVLTYLCLLTFYPSPEVFDAPVPWLPMLETVGGTAVVALFGVVMGWTLLETSVGMIHALLDRVDEDLAGRPSSGAAEGDADADAVGRERTDTEAEGADSVGVGERKGGLTSMQAALLGIGLLLAAALLSRVGIIALVARGYALMGFLFIGLFAVPLLTVGIWRIRKRRAAA